MIPPMVRALCGGVLWLTLLSLPVAALAFPPSSREGVLDDLIARGDAALARGDSISAIAYYRDAVSRQPRNPRGYVALGRAYLAVHEPEHAREAFETGLRHTRGSEELSLGLAQTYEQQGALLRALRVLREQAAEGVRSVAVLESIARLSERSGMLTEALAARRALLAQLESEQAVDAERRREARVRVAALSLLLGPSDRLSRVHCAHEEDSAFLHALRDCR